MTPPLPVAQVTVFAQLAPDSLLCSSRQPQGGATVPVLWRT
jgi:hypothetical protein